MVKRTYDADGAGAGAATSQFWVYDEGINAALQFDGPAASDLSHRYLWTGVVDELMADETVGSGADTLYALADHLGTIRDIANFNESTSATTVTNHRTYNSYGKLVSETNAAVDLIFGYTGKQLDEATGLQHNLFRWYDSSLGQWLSEDPLGFAAGDENVRRYVGNEAIGLVDPEGLEDYAANFLKAMADHYKLIRDQKIKDAKDQKKGEAETQKIIQAAMKDVLTQTLGPNQIHHLMQQAARDAANSVRSQAAIKQGIDYTKDMHKANNLCAVATSYHQFITAAQNAYRQSLAASLPNLKSTATYSKIYQTIDASKVDDEMKKFIKFEAALKDKYKKYMFAANQKLEKPAALDDTTRDKMMKDALDFGKSQYDALHK